MDVKFLDQVQKAVRLVRRREYEALGESEFAKYKCVQKRLYPSPQASSLYEGRVVAELFRDVIETGIKPTTPRNVERIEWKTYLSPCPKIT